MDRKIRILIAKLGMDVHSRGVLLVCKQLLSYGMEIVYIGNSMPQNIIQTAIQESVDAIGVSSLSGSHLVLGRKLIEEKRKAEFRCVMVIGGVFPPGDKFKLKNSGFDYVFQTGAALSEISRIIECLVILKESNNVCGGA